MKALKYLAVLAVALFAISSASKAQTIQFLGGGSSALFLELGQAAQVQEGGANACVWTQNALSDNDIAAKDSRPTTPDLQNGKIWVVWDKGSGASCDTPAAPYNIYAYMSLDSVIGDRCYFATDSGGVSGCIQVMTPTVAESAKGTNLLGTGFLDTNNLPSTVASALNNQRWFVAGTDIRPEDAKFASYRMFQNCGSAVLRQPFDQGLRQIFGLGYGNGVQPGLVGTPVQSDFSSTTFSVIDFNITGNDPLSGKAVPSYTVSTVGAQPIIVAVGPAGGTGIGAATDINTFTLTLFYQGVLGRNTDLLGPSVTAPVTTLVREPLSGTYNTFEFSVPNSSQFHGSQDDNNCSGTSWFSNPMHLQSANGQTIAGGAAFRRRVIGTSEMVKQIQNATTSDQRLGYWFWSAANAANFTSSNGKYLTVNGVDPILDSYSGNLTCGNLANAPNDGVIPNATNGNLPCVTFKWLNMGDYPIWSALRLVSKSPTPAGVTNLISSAQTLNSTQNDFIPLSKLQVWHSHYYIPVINSVVSANGNTINTANDLCNAPGALGEFGGDAGGANVLKVANADFCADFGNQNGLINKAN